MKGEVVEDEHWTMRVGEATHVQPFLKCLAYRLETQAGTLVYSGDSGGVPDGMIELAREADVLIHMCHFPTGLEKSTAYREATGSHMDVAAIAARARVKVLVLTHMIALMDRPGVKERVLSEMREVFDGPIILGEDLMEVPIAVEYPHHID